MEKVRDFTKKHADVLKVIAIILGIIVVIGGLFIASEKTRDNSRDKAEQNLLLEEGQFIDEEKMKDLEEITYEDFQKYLKEKNTTTVIMLGSASCGWCTEQKPILKMAMYNDNVDVKYLDVSTLTSEEYTELQELHDDLANFGTPTFISVKNKKVLKVSENAKTTSQLHDMFVDMEIIEK